MRLNSERMKLQNVTKTTMRTSNFNFNSQLLIPSRCFGLRMQSTLILCFTRSKIGYKNIKCLHKNSGKFNKNGNLTSSTDWYDFCHCHSTCLL